VDTAIPGLDEESNIYILSSLSYRVKGLNVLNHLIKKKNREDFMESNKHRIKESSAGINQ
jgi:hypothetical protein